MHLIVRPLFLSFALVALFAAPFAANAQPVPLAAAMQAVVSRYSPEVEREARQLFGEILSPYCPGLTLTSCPSEGAFLLKDSIRAELAAGRTPAEVMRGLEARFGPEIHARPPTSGFGLLAWIGPFVLIGAAGLGITWWVRSSARAAAATAVPAPGVELDPEMRERLEAALRRDG